MLLPEAALTRIEAGLTNRNYKATDRGQIYFLRFGRENPAEWGIDRPTEWAVYRLVERAGVAPALLFFDPETGHMAAEFIEGKPYGKMNGQWLEEREGAIEKIVRLLKRYHCIPAPANDETNFALDIIDCYLQSTVIADAQELCAAVRAIAEQLPPATRVLCHHDLCADNFIARGAELFLIDWEYARWSDPLYDLASLCVEQQYDAEEKDMVLLHYFGIVTEEKQFHLDLMCRLYMARGVLWATKVGLPEVAAFHRQNFYRK